MQRSFTEKKRFRKNFGRIKEIAQLPNLIALQKQSYEKFLQINIRPEERVNVGLQNVFKTSFPIKDNSGKAQLDFCKYYFEPSKHTEEECRKRGLTFAAPLRVVFRLIVWDVDQSTSARTIKDIKEQDVYVCDLPLMTRDGTFIVNGIERVVVSQMQKSPGVFFNHDSGKTHSSGKFLYSAHVIPYKGVWIDFEFDPKDNIYVRIDRKRKFLASTLLLALDSVETEELKDSAPGKEFKTFEITGMSRKEILDYFYDSYKIKYSGGEFTREYIESEFIGTKSNFDLINAKNGEVLLSAGEKFNKKAAKKFKDEKVSEVLFKNEDLVGSYLAVDVINLQNGKIIAEAGTEITQDFLSKLDHDTSEIAILKIDHVGTGSYIRNTLALDRCYSREDALLEIYRVLRPSDPPTIEGAENLFHGLFFDPDKYSLLNVGRMKINQRLNLSVPETQQTLTKKDFLLMLKTLHELKDGQGVIDDIDNLSNRRVRAVGELLENQFATSLVRVERNIKERMTSIDVETAVPNDLFNAKPISSAIREFFCLSQLSQFMDQTNPLSGVTHKRRLSALGPGGIVRERAGFDVRDVHPTHYGRICPIETPESVNIGLINSMATFARVNKYGFIESPYRKMQDGKVTQEIVYMSAHEESGHTMGQANTVLNDDGSLTQEFVTARRNGEFITAERNSIDYLDISPKQTVSVAASLIPFVENDDAGRALMGSNMQRQAVPLLRAKAPLVGTGMEKIVGKDSGATVVAKRDGIVDQVDARRIVVNVVENNSIVGVDIYNLRKFERSNQSTCINQFPIVKKGDVLKSGDIIADGTGTDLGELALGQNALVGFMMWNGYGFEDAIVISERMVKDDYFTSIHIEEFEVMARDTKLGHEEITRDIPNVGNEALKNLDETGIVHIGAEVRPGDILVGKVTPKVESPITPEEKLLRAIFGEKASDVKDSSLRLPPGTSGVVVDVKVFLRCGVEKDERTIAIEKREIDFYKKDFDVEKAILDKNFYERLIGLLNGHEIEKSPVKFPVKFLNFEELKLVQKHHLSNIVVKDENTNALIDKLKKEYNLNVTNLKASLENKIEKLKKGDELSPGVLKVVKVYVAEKRKLQPGDKLAGRHGNKGVVSKIVPVQDMPFMADGTPLDIVVNPLGVASRMNIGQILETHLGWASICLGKQVRKLIENIQDDNELMVQLRSELKKVYNSKEELEDLRNASDYEVAELASNIVSGVPTMTPVFDGARESDIVKIFKDTGVSTSGQVELFDGRTGDSFGKDITVGCMYMLKLDHMVDDKIHARSIGPYSLVTQQPLGGKAQFGGQRFGEMEVWALQAYGAAYTLQEVLTVKSDDVEGRSSAYASIISCNDNIVPGIPESFNVLRKELGALCLDLEFKTKEVDVKEVLMENEKLIQA